MNSSHTYPRNRYCTLSLMNKVLMTQFYRLLWKILLHKGSRKLQVGAVCIIHLWETSWNAVDPTCSVICPQTASFYCTSSILIQIYALIHSTAGTKTVPQTIPICNTVVPSMGDSLHALQYDLSLVIFSASEIIKKSVKDSICNVVSWMSPQSCYKIQSVDRFLIPQKLNPIDSAKWPSGCMWIIHETSPNNSIQAVQSFIIM